MSATFSSVIHVYSGLSYIAITVLHPFNFIVDHLIRYGYFIPDCFSSLPEGSATGRSPVSSQLQNGKRYSAGLVHIQLAHASIDP